MPTNSSPEKSFLAALQTQLPSALPQFLLQQRWFGGKARPIHSVEISGHRTASPTVNAYLILAQVNYASGPAETYAIPLAPGLERRLMLLIAENPTRQAV